jgi:hypothetical protein
MSNGQSYLVRRIREGHAALFEQTWPLWLAGVVIAFLSIMMFAWERPLGVVAGLRNWGDWLFTSIGAYNKALQSPLVNYASVIDIGFLLGAFASALLAREFSVRVPPRAEAVKGLAAGILMGIGSSLAQGCNVGGFFTALSALSLGGFAMMVGLIFGVYVGLRYLLWELERFPTSSSAPPSGEKKEGGFDWRRVQPWIGYAILLGSIIAFFQYSGSAYTKSGGLLLLSLAVGLTFQRSRLCFVAAFRDPFMTGESRQTKAMLLSLVVAVLGYAVLKWTGLRGEMVYVTDTFWLGGLAGGFIFGIGMVLAGGCGSGTLWRVGEGQVKLWIVLVSFSLSNAAVRYYLESTGLMDKLGKAVFMPDWFTYKWSVIIIAAVAALWYIAADWNEEKETFVVS